MSGSPGRPPPVADQAERTQLAWTRSLTTLAGVSVILVRWLSRDTPLVIVLLVITLGAVVAISVTQRRRIERQLVGLRSGTLDADVWGCAALAATVTFLGLAGVALLVLTSS